ncbi:MAG: NADH-dependent [FeFe] hydrogenase, group A6 [Bacteroidales bacterium]|nr:NADH-dependent [FeFe] hydrogenase, group A6 [Bacteroidales bacterium]
MSFLIEVDNKMIEAREGETFLSAVNRNGTKIPTLCYMKDRFPSGACRMCVVEELNSGKLITACSYPVYEGAKILTHSPRVIEARKSIVELLLANHPDDCLYCVRNKNCELQDLSQELDVCERNYSSKKQQHKIDRSGVSILRDPAKCILCGRCVRTCTEVMGVSAIDFINRGSQSTIGTVFNKGLNTSSCVNCGQCIIVCPTGALSETSHIAEIQDALSNPEKVVVVQYAPAIPVSVAEAFDMKPGSDLAGVLNAALRKVGFDKVFDTSFSADLTIMEEASELIHRVKNNETLPLITSCCPAWVKYAEEFYPEMLPNVSSCKSPQQMMGAIIKSYWAELAGVDPKNIYSVSVMPCTAKKFEAQREEMTQNGISDVDAVLTTREFVQFMKKFGVDIKNLDPELPDSPMGFRSSAGKIFGASGGVMEAAIRTAYQMITGKELIRFKINQVRGMEHRKETKITVDNLELGVAVVNGLGNAKELLEEIKNGRDDIHFIEVMACPGGCIAGGGQCINVNENFVEARRETIYDIDNKDSVKVSHKNPEVKNLYNCFLGEPLGEKSHHLLHTHYNKRDVLK